MSDLPTVPELRVRLAPLFDDPRIELVIVFGSILRGVLHSKSDVDLAVQGGGPLDIVMLTNQITRLLRTDRVDVVDLRRISPLLMMEVVRGGVLLHERVAGSYVAFCSLAHRRYVDTAKLRVGQREAIRQFLRARGVA
jgi:predicted nucleotidyltransferase